MNLTCSHNAKHIFLIFITQKIKYFIFFNIFNLNNTKFLNNCFLEIITLFSLFSENLYIIYFSLFF